MMKRELIGLLCIITYTINKTLKLNKPGSISLMNNTISITKMATMEMRMM